MQYHLDVWTDNPTQGCVTGDGCHPQGTHTINTIARDGYAFQQWSDGNTDNPRYVNLTSDTTFVAFFELSTCDTINQFPWEAEISETMFNCWETVGDEMLKWMILQNSLTVLWSGHGDNLLISPYVLVAPQTILHYTVSAMAVDSLSVVVITADNDTIVMNDLPIPVVSNSLMHVDISPFAGQLVRLGFRQHMTGAYGMLSINSIRIDNMQGIGDVNAEDFTVTASGLNITVTGATEGQLNIYDAMGRRVVSSNEANGTFSLPSTGVYIVRVGEHSSRKVVVLK